MPGTLLLDDWRNEVQDRVNQHITDLQRSTQSALQNVTQGAQSAQQAIEDPAAVAARVQAHVDSLIQPAQQAATQVIQPLGDAAGAIAQGAQQQAGQVIQPLGDVASRVQQHVDSLLGPQATLTPLGAPAAPVAAQADVLGAPSADTTPSSSQPDPQNVAQYIRGAAIKRGIDPNVAVLVAQSEGLNTYVGDSNSSFGPYQLHYGGVATGGNAVPGLGDTFTRETGLDARDPSTWQKQVDFSLDQAKASGWTPWHGAERVGVGARDGLPGPGGGAEAVDAQRGAALPHNEEPASSTDTLGDKWKTQFDFKATYTGDYRTGTPHRGVDLVPQKGGIGTEVDAFVPGQVTNVFRDPGGAGGLIVYVQDAQGLTHAYMHLADATVAVGDQVGRGTPIAHMGESGTEGSPHLHYEVRANAANGDPLDKLIDPRPYVRGAGAQAGPTATQGVTALPPSSEPGANVVDRRTKPQQMTVTNLGGPPETPTGPMRATYNAANQAVTPLGQLQDTVGGALGAAGEAIGGAASDLGTTARGVANQIGPNLGFDDAELQRRRAATAAQQPPTPPTPPPDLGGPPLNAGDIIGMGARALMTGTGAQGVVQSPEQIQAAQKAATGPITSRTEEALGYVKLPGQTEPVPVLQGLSTMLVEQAFAAPYMIPGALGASALNSIGRAVIGEAAADAPALVQIAARAGQGAINAAIQNAILAAGEPNADAQSVGAAFLQGGIFGGVLEGSPTAAVKIGQALIRRMPNIQPVLEQALRSRQRGEVDLGLITTGEPTPREAPVSTPRPPDRLTEERFPGIPRESAPPPAAPPAGVQRLPNYPAGQIEQRVEDVMRASRESSADGLAHVNLNDLPDDVMPFNRNAAPGQNKIAKLNPGGMPTMDDLRALYAANEHKRSFYVDQGDAAAPLVGQHNAEEFFTLNSIMSQGTGVTRQVAEAIQSAGLVRKTAQDGRAAGLPPEQIRQNILDALQNRELNPLSSKTLNNKYSALAKGYGTGEAPVSSGAKTSVFAGNYGSAEGRFFDPRVTNDVHNWRIMNVSSDMIPSERLNKKTGQKEWFYDTPHESAVANNDQAYRAVESVFNELARERGVDGYSVQSAMWDGIRAMQNRDPTSYRLWQQGFFKRAIDRAQARGVFGQTTGLGVDLKEGDIQRVMNSMPVQRELAKWGSYLKDPLPPELNIGTVSRTYAGTGRTAALRRPSNLPFREGERVVAESDAPLVHGLDGETVNKLGYDPERGIFPWLESSHRVVQTAPDEWAVHLPGGNEDTARYVAAQVGQAADAPVTRIHVPDHRAPDVIGMYARGTPEEIQTLAHALDNMGLPAVRGTGGRSLQVPFATANDAATVKAVEDAALSVGMDPATALGRYTGRTADVPRAEYGPTSGRLSTTFAPTTPERSDLLQRGLGAVPEGEQGAAVSDAATAGARGAGVPGARGAVGRLVRGEEGSATPLGGINIAGSAFGALAGNAATPQDSPLDVRLRNIGVGALTGLAGTHALTRGGPRLAEALAARDTRLGVRPEGFRAPESLPGRDILQARTGDRVGLGDVHSNPHLLREPQAGEAPLSDDELAAHFDDLQSRYEANQTRLDAVDEQLRNPKQKPERPPWGAGYTNDQLVELARRQGISAYEPLWWEKVGLETGSGEVREDVGQSGIQRGMGQREPTPAELRSERNQLAQEQKDLVAASEQLGNAPAGTQFAKRTQEQGDLPFDDGASANGVHGPYAVQNSGSSGELAADIITRNGTKRPPSGLKGLWSEAGQVVGRAEGVTGRGISDAEKAGVAPPSAETLKRMPNLDALLGEDMPEVRAQIQKAIEDNPDLFEKYDSGQMSHDDLRDDLARRVGMTTKDWLKTKVGQGFSVPEQVALQAAAVDMEVGMTDMAREIAAKPGGVDALTPEETAFALGNLLDATRLLDVARGGRSTQGRGLNALKIRMTAALARGITASNERIGAERMRDQARRMATRATQLLNKTHDLDAEARQAVNGARERGASKGIIDQIAEAYDQLDRYQAMTLHEKADVFNALQKQRAEAAAARKAVVREAPQELLSALKAELKAEQDNFAKRKDTWETMAFWDTKANENAIAKRTAFRGGLYIEQARKAANIAAKGAEQERARAFDAEIRRRDIQRERASRILENIGGEKPTKDLLRNFVEAINSDDPMVAAKFLKGITPARGKFATIVEIARNANVMRLAGMLAGTATHMANMTGNTIQPPLKLAEHAVVVGIDKALTAMTGGERVAYGAELGPMARGWFRTSNGGRQLGFLTTLPDAVKVLQTGITPAETADLSKLRPGFRSGIPGAVGEVVDPTIEMPLRALQASDVMFRGGAFGMEAERVATRRAIQEGFSGQHVARRANNIIQNLEDYPELYKEASDGAARMVYQERRTIPGLSRMHEAGPGAEAARIATSQVLPFKMTPANIFSQGFGLSPFGALGALEAVGSRGAIAEKVASGALPREALARQKLLVEQRAARALLGTGILGAAYVVGSMRDDQGKPVGALTAMYDENEASTYPPGWRAWSMRLENPKDKSITYVPLQNFGVAGVPLAMAAILTDSERRGHKVWEGTEPMRAATGIGRYAIDNTFLQGVSDWVDALHDPGRAGPKAIESLVASYGPYSGMGRQVQRAFGIASRNPREGWLALLDALEADYPGLSGNVPEATTVLGDPRVAGQSGAGAFISPIRYDIEKDEPTLRVLRENDVRIPAEPKQINIGRGQSIDLTEAEQDQVKRARGPAIRQAVAQIQQSTAWQRAGGDITKQNELLKQAVSYATRSAIINFYRTLPPSEVQSRAANATVPEPYYIGSPAG